MSRPETPPAPNRLADATPSPPARELEAHDIFPPVPLRRVYRLALFGLACAAAAGVISLAVYALPDALSWPGVSTLRLALVGVGAVVAGHALTLRPAVAGVWGVAALTAALASVAGTPPHWDSLRLLFGVLAGLAAFAAGVLLLPVRFRAGVVAGAVVCHFASIFTATLWPDPSPWIVGQVGTRVFLPYMQFAYLRNAYHFYSPEPGPASLLFALVRYERDVPGAAPETKSEWTVLPHRGKQTVDPLGQTYYRRLSITNYSSRFQPDLGGTSAERQRVEQDRNQVAAGLYAYPDGRKYPRIPHPPLDYEPRLNWYQPPQADAARYLLPSYARHIAAESARETGWRVTNVKMYRSEHRIGSVQAFVMLRSNPYNPIWYRTYFLGDFAADGQLVDPHDPMLYWIVPTTLRKADQVSEPASADIFAGDSLTDHSGHQFDWSSLRP